MRLRKTIFAACSALLILVAADGAFAQDKQQEELSVLAAFKALQAKCAAYSYAVVDTSVRAAVLNQLREAGGPSPKAMPTAQQLQSNLAGDFELQWNQLITEVTNSLDRDGKKKLAERLNDFVTKNPTVRKETEAKYLSFLTKELPQVLAQVEKQLITEQSEQLEAALKEVVAAGEPSEQQVYEAAGGDAQKVETTVLAAVQQRIPGELQPVLLIGAVDALKGQVNSTVDDAVIQLEDQRGVFAKSDAVSIAGLKQDFEKRIGEVAARQQNLRRNDPLLPSFGVFARVRSEIDSAAESVFGQLVAEASKQVQQDVEAGKLVPGKQDEDILRKIITDDRQSHHLVDTSLKLLAPKTQELITEKQSWIVNGLNINLKQSTQEGDKTVDERQFRSDILRVLNDPNSQGYQSWATIQGYLKRRYEGIVVPKIRTEIRDTQSAEYTLKLAGRDWWPSEAEVEEIPTPLTASGLANVSGLWRQTPPQRVESLLEETWNLWLGNAKHAVGLFTDAQTDQWDVVDDLRDPMLRQMAAESTRGPAEWRDEYVRQATAKWQSRPSGAVEHYPDLFQSTRERIQGIIAQLLPEAAKLELERPQEVMEVVPVEPKEVMPGPDESIAEPQDNAANNGTGAAGGANNGKQGGGGSGDGPREKGPSEEPGGNALEGGDDPFDLSMREEGEQGADEGKRKQVNNGEGSKLSDSGIDEQPETFGDNRLSLPLEDESVADLFYVIGFWVLLLMVIVITGCWYWNVRVLKRQLAALQRRELF